MRRLGGLLMAVGLMMTAAPAVATYDAPPYGHHEVREIVIIDHTGDVRMANGAQQAADLWNAAGANFHITVEPGIVSTDDSVCYDASVAGHIHLCMDLHYAYQGGFTSWDYEPGSSTHIRAAYVHMCGVGTNFCFDFDDPNTLARILPHEVGHALGLYHQSSPSRGDTCSIMSVTCYSESLSNEDRNTLQALYAHSDGVTTSTTVVTTTISIPTTTTSTTSTTTTVVSTTTTAPVTTTTTTTTAVSALCSALAAQYAAYAGNPQAQALIGNAQAQHGC